MGCPPSRGNSTWLHLLHVEFCGYYWEFIEDFPGTLEQRAEMRGAALVAVGWLPSDIPPARLRAAELAADEANSLSAGDESSEAQDVRTAAEHWVRVARHAADNFRLKLASSYKR